MEYMTDQPIRFPFTKSFAEPAQDSGLSLLLTSYQAGKLLVIRPKPEGGLTVDAELV